MAWLEVEDPKLACHGRTGAWPNGERVDCGQRKCEGGCLRGWRVGSRCEEVIVRKVTVTSLEKASNSRSVPGSGSEGAFSCPRTAHLFGTAGTGVWCVLGSVVVLVLRHRVG